MKYYYFLSNNDYIDKPVSVAEVVEEVRSELNLTTGMVLIVREDYTSREAIKEVQNLLWLMQKNYERKDK